MQRTHTSKFVLYHLILKYSRGKDSISILASEHLYFLVSSCSTRLKSLQCPDSPSPQNNHCNVSHLQYKKSFNEMEIFFPLHSTDYTGYSDLIYKLLSDNDIADILNITWRQIWKLIHDIQGLTNNIDSNILLTMINRSLRRLLMAPITRSCSQTYAFSKCSNILMECSVKHFNYLSVKYIEKNCPFLKT